MISRFCEKVKKSRPTEREIEALKTMLKGFRISLPKQIDDVKQYVAKNESIKKKIESFLLKPRPNIEAVKEMANSLKKESILFEKSIKKLNEMVTKCKGLVKMAEKDPHNPKLIVAYKDLNISCPEFENLVREKKLDDDLVKKY